VDKWKKSRTRAPQQQEDSNTVRNVLGTGAVAAGLAGAAAYGYRRGWGKAADVAADVGKEGATSNIVRNLPNVDNVTGLADTTFIPSPITPQDSRGVKLVGTKNKQTGTYRASVNEIQKEPQVTSQQALDDYKKHYINEKSTGSRSDIASLQEGIRQDKLARGDKEISRGYFESDAKRQEQELASRGFNETDLPEKLEDQPAPGVPSPDDPASYSPRTYIESTGAIAPKTKQFSENQLIELNQYASSVADYDGNPDFIRINDKLDNYLEGRTNVYPLTQEDIQKFNESLTDLKKVDPGAFDDQLDQLSSDVSVSLDREVKEQTLVAQQKTIGPELTEQTLESANSGYEQMDDAFDRSVQRDTDSIAVGSQAVEVEKTQQALLQDAKLKAAAAIENRRIQLEQNTNLDPRSTRFDNALAREWATKPNVDPSIGSEDFRKTVQAPKDVEDFISTEIPETDASNVARNYYNEDTGNIQFATEDGGSPLIRDIYKEKVLPSEDVSKAASGGTIRGQSRSLDIQEPQRRTRTDEFTGDISPDTPGGLTGFPKGPRPRGVQLSNEASPALPLNQRAPRTQVQSLLEGEVERIDDYANQGGGAGMGVYGREQGYVAGPNSKTVTGLRSTGLRAKPTDLPETRKGREFNPQTKRDEFRDLSNNALRNIISRGTYRNNKQGKTAREAQYELKLRKDLAGNEWKGNAENYAPNTEKAKKSMEISRDIQNIYNSGRPDAQEQVQAYIQGLRQGQQF
jgi:hypothetical protein